MEIIREHAIELIKEQMKEQGCNGDTIREIELLQPHLYQWIMFFRLSEEDLL